MRSPKTRIQLRLDSRDLLALQQEAGYQHRTINNLVGFIVAGVCPSEEARARRERDISERADVAISAIAKAGSIPREASIRSIRARIPDASCVCAIGTQS